MADQPQTSADPFVQQYGQLRLAPITTQDYKGTSQDTKIAAGVSAKSPAGKGDTPVPPGKPKPASGVAASTNDKTNGKSILPYLAGAGAATAGAYAIKRYLDKRTGKVVEEVVPVESGNVPATVSPQTSGGELDPVTRPQWRYVTPETAGVPAVSPGKSVVPYIPREPALNPQAIEAITRVLK